MTIIIISPLLFLEAFVFSAFIFEARNINSHSTAGIESFCIPSWYIWGHWHLENRWHFLYNMVYGSKLYYIPVNHRQRTLLASNIQCSFNATTSCFIRIDTKIILLKIIKIISTNMEVKDGDLEKILAGKRETEQFRSNFIFS